MTNDALYIEYELLNMNGGKNKNIYQNQITSS